MLIGLYVLDNIHVEHIGIVGVLMDDKMKDGE